MKNELYFNTIPHTRAKSPGFKDLGQCSIGLHNNVYTYTQHEQRRINHM